MKNRNHNGQRERDFVSLQEFIESGRIRKALHFACRLTGNLQESQELVQETCYRVCLSWEQYDQTQSLEGWFFTILKNIFRDSRRNPERHISLDNAMKDVDSECLTHAEFFADGNYDILEQLEKDETISNVRQAMSQIGGHHKRVLEHRAFEGSSYAEIAAAEAIPVGTVRSRVFRGRKSVQKQLDEMEVSPCFVFADSVDGQRMQSTSQTSARTATAR